MSATPKFTAPDPAIKPDKASRQWAVGDTCHLNSGSVAMTVTGFSATLHGEQLVDVAWMKYPEGELRRDTLPVLALNKDRKK